MSSARVIFEQNPGKPATVDGLYSHQELQLANRNAGFILELLHHDVTPTGAHYLLTHFDVPLLDPEHHRITFGAGFERPFDLGLTELRQRPQLTIPVTMECAGNGRAGVSPRTHSMPWADGAIGTAEWTGTPLAPLLEEAQPVDGTVDIVFTGADEGFDNGVRHFFARSLSLDRIAALDVLLVHEMNGAPLLPQHGAPMRLVVPGWYGMASVKWLTTIEAIAEPYRGLQQIRNYNYRNHPDEPGIPVEGIRVRALMVPPGLPDWVTRFRHLEPGRHNIVGRAWAGRVPISKVEFGIDDTWIEAELSPAKTPFAWSKWSVAWDASPGEHVLRCKATDAEGNCQPLTPRWDAAGLGNNEVQKVVVYVSGDAA